MEVITKFRAIDGKEFVSEKECIKYEALIISVNKIMDSLSKKPNDSSFLNGDGFLQHDEKVVTETKTRILEICKVYIDHKWIQQTIDEPKNDPSWVSRILGDYNIKPLSDAWYRFSCMDKTNREWGQPYFAMNPKDGKQIQLN